jgi:hypothetical protein
VGLIFGDAVFNFESLRAESDSGKLFIYCIHSVICTKFQNQISVNSKLELLSHLS